ncbi:DUF5696 domain-containing protein [Paenibacillus eucommiae]|uniref:Uncharacterized protein n=1 Tax=Paenibacillus eucommiae TaxID=1355755 RepID=A0ABS4IVX5_9BACL|nr:DUF5696 domain-containing protein [Paenibacillus eucommiae]MBP1991746.1 hypothetical protein [Paenibacillus eucommiae]
MINKVIKVIHIMNRKTIIGLAWLLVILCIGSWLILRIGLADGSAVTFHYDSSMGRPAGLPIGDELPPGKGLQTFAEDGQWVFSADLDSQLFQVRDKRSGVVWSSSPVPEALTATNQTASQIAGSPILLSYTTQFKDILTTSLLTEDVTWKSFKMEGGVQIYYELPRLQLAFTVEYTLRDGGLHVRLPEDGISEGGAAAITSLELFPMFEAAKQGEKGYVVVPDGSGALMYFDRPHTFINRGYEKWIYGVDPVFDFSRTPPIGERLTLPLLGMVKENGGYVQTILKGAEDAKIVINPPGVYNVDYYRGGMEFALRKTYATKLSKAGSDVLLVEKERIRSDREIRFDFLAGSRVGYPQLAEIVRERLMSSDMSPDTSLGLEQTSEGDPYNAPLIRLLMGTEKREDGLSGSLVITTTFNEGGVIMDELLQAGVEKLTVGLKGWQQAGAYGDTHHSVKPDARFGGEKGLNRLLQQAEQLGVAIALEDNETDIYSPRKSKVDMRSQVVRKPDGSLYTHLPLGPTGSYRTEPSWYLLNAAAAEHMRGPKLDAYEELGVPTVNLQRTGDTLSSDYNRKNPLRRNQWAIHEQQALSDIRSRLGSVGVFYGYLYAAKEADRIIDIPISTSPDDLLDEQIPFLQLVYHGSLTYYASPVNRSENPQMQLLRAIEYGAIPSFELTYRPTVELRDTYEDRLFSGEYSEWMADVQKAYSMWDSALKDVYKHQMTDHREMAEGVYRTTYEDGTSIWVNYGSLLYDSNGAVVKPMSFAVYKGGEGL